MAGGSGYAGKPRPVLIVQDDAFAERDSVTVCLITTDPADLPVFRKALGGAFPLATGYKREREQDLAGQEGLGGSGSGQPRERGHGWRKDFLLLPRRR